jgi:hypothetical protein
VAANHFVCGTIRTLSAELHVLARRLRRIVKGRAIAYLRTAVIRQLMPFEDVHGNNC